MLNRKFEKPKAGLLFIASSRFRNLGDDLPQGTYHQRKEKDVEQVIQSLSKEVDVACPGIVYEREDIIAAMQYFFAEKVDFIVTEYLSWAEDFTWVRFMRDMPDIPILYVSKTREKVCFETTLDDNDFIEFLCAGNLVGSLESAGSIARTDRKNVRIIMGSREELNAQICTFAKVAQVRSILRHSVFGLLSGYNEVMWSTYIDPYDIFTKIGPEIRFLSYSVLSEEIQKVSDEDTAVYRDELVQRYPVSEDVDQAKFFESVRASIALARISEKRGIDMMAFNDVDHEMFELIGLRPGFYPSWYEKNLSVLVPEADIGAGCITYILKLLSKKHVNFIEPFHIETEHNTFAAGHAGPNDHTDPANRQNVLIARDVRFAKTKFKYAGAPFAWCRYSPGWKTMAQLVEQDGQYKLVATMVECLPGKHLFASYSHSIFRPQKPVEELFEQILKIGTTQHFAIVDGDYRKELSMLSDVMGFKYFEL